MTEDNKTPHSMPVQPAAEAREGGVLLEEDANATKAAAEKAAADKLASEQLIKMLDIQLAASRNKRTAETSNRNAMRIFAIAFIVIGAALALWVLMYMLEEMRPEKPMAEPTAEEIAR